MPSLRDEEDASRPSKQHTFASALSPHTPEPGPSGDRREAPSRLFEPFTDRSAMPDFRAHPSAKVFASGYLFTAWRGMTPPYSPPGGDKCSKIPS